MSFSFVPPLRVVNTSPKHFVLDRVRISDESRCQLASIRLGRNSSLCEPSRTGHLKTCASCFARIGFMVYDSPFRVGTSKGKTSSRASRCQNTFLFVKRLVKKYFYDIMFVGAFWYNAYAIIVI